VELFLLVQDIDLWWDFVTTAIHLLSPQKGRIWLPEWLLVSEKRILLCGVMTKIKDKCQSVWNVLPQGIWNFFKEVALLNVYREVCKDTHSFANVPNPWSGCKACIVWVWQTATAFMTAKGSEPCIRSKASRGTFPDPRQCGLSIYIL
jgi:hypothetical protein